jgi:hypothetical protein
LLDFGVKDMLEAEAMGVMAAEEAMGEREEKEDKGVR